MQYDFNFAAARVFLTKCLLEIMSRIASVLEITATVEPRFNEPLYNEFLDLTNDILRPSNGKVYGKEPRYDETSA